MDCEEENRIMTVQAMIRNMFGKKLSLWSYSLERERFEGILYGALHLSCEFDRSNTIGFSIDVGGLPVTDFFGHSGLVFATPEGIAEAHGYIDEYCRALLPDKFLERFESTLPTHR